MLNIMIIGDTLRIVNKYNFVILPNKFIEKGEGYLDCVVEVEGKISNRKVCSQNMKIWYNCKSQECVPHKKVSLLGSEHT